MKIAFLQDSSGNYSLSRLIVFICVNVALIFCAVILYLGHKDVMNAALAIATVFGAIAIPSLTFLFKQRETEAKTEISAKKQDTTVEKEIINQTTK